MKQRRIFLATDADTLNLLHAHEIQDSFPLSEAERVGLTHCEVIVIGPGQTAAKDEAMKLAERGIPKPSLSYIDLRGNENIPAVCAWPKHLFWDDVRPLTEFEDRADAYHFCPSGMAFLDTNFGFRWRLPELCVAAGPYGSGKSMLAQILAFEFVAGAGIELNSGAMLCAWEDQVRGVKLAAQRHAEGKQISPQEFMSRVHFINRHPDDDRLISWYMDLVQYHRERYNTRFFVLDPWNEVDHQKDARQSETDYIRDMMKAFRRLVDKLKIILIIVTHVPAKFVRGNGEVEPFKLAHAFGSVQFANKADRGLCVVRSKAYSQDGHMIIRQDKAKDEEFMGRRGTVAARYDRGKHRLEYDGYVTAALQDIWKD